MARGKRYGHRGGKRKHGKQAVSLTKKQKKHYKDFGEAHPADERDTRTKYTKVEDREDEGPKTSSSSESESEPEQPSTYHQLLGSLSGNKSSKQQDSDVESDIDEDVLGGNDLDDELESVDCGEDDGDVDDEDNSDVDDGDEDMDDNLDEDEKANSGDEGVSDNSAVENDKFDKAESDEADDDEGDEDDTNDSILATDPFALHFEKDIDEKFADQLESGKPWIKEPGKLPTLGKCQWISPDYEQTKSRPNLKEMDIRKLHVKNKLCEQLIVLQGKHSASDCFTPIQQELFAVMNNYQDINYPHRTTSNGEEIRTVYCLHALNHVLKTRSRVIAHNNKIKGKTDDGFDDYRDQGLTRPKVLIVVPFRDSALRIVNLMIKLLMSESQTFVTNKKRFMSEYSDQTEEVKKGLKPEDYEAIFTGNIDDHFRIGLGVAKKSLKLYTDFYSADIIIASPLGLRTVIGAEGENERDFDFLSSIEMLIFDQTDIFLMQNWDHIMHLMSHLHLQPKESHGVDFSRVRMWTLNGWSKYYRQTLLFSALATPEINALFSKHCQNYAGKVVISNPQTSGAICQIVTQLPQVFQRITCSTHAQLAEERFQYFIKKVLPQYRDAVMAQTLIFIPSYFDYVRLRNYFLKEEIKNVCLCEYTKDKAITKGRSFFYHGRTHFMLYTERLHFYRRFKIRGIKHLIFYSLPQYPHFYSELCNMLQDFKNPEQLADNWTCTVLYLKYDAQRLSEVVGTERAGHMLNSDRNVHMFVTGEMT